MDSENDTLFDNGKTTPAAFSYFIFENSAAETFMKK
jgi:hypothetical protein